MLRRAADDGGSHATQDMIAGAALLGAAPLIARTAKPRMGRSPSGSPQTLTAHDLDAFAALFAEGYVNHQASAAAPPPPAGVKPKAATVAFFAARLKGLPDLKVAIQATLARG